MTPSLTLADIDQRIETLDRHEPTAASALWRPAYDALDVSLAKARHVRRLWAIPAVIVAAVLTIIFHGSRWDFDDARNVFAFEVTILVLIWFVMGKAIPVLAREDRVAALLRYYGAQDVPQEERIVG